jgi:hypothetical protein
MPIDKSRVDKLIATMDSYLKQLEQDQLNGYCDDDEDDDPVQFGNPPRDLPVAEPANINVDSPPQRIHGAGSKKDLFS